MKYYTSTYSIYYFIKILINFIINNETNVNLKNIKMVGILNMKDYKNILKLDCSFNRIIYIKNLSESLIELNCCNNIILLLNNLPQNI